MQNGNKSSCLVEAEKPQKFLEDLNSGLESEIKAIADTCYFLDEFITRSLGYNSIFEPCPINVEENRDHRSKVSSNMLSLHQWNERLVTLRNRINEIG